MFLAPDGEEIELMDMVAGFLAESMPISRLHVHGQNNADLRPDLRQTLGGMGWFGLAVSEEKGGSGLSAVEYTLFFREVGRQCGPVDVLAQSLAALACNDESLRSKFLSGEEGVALAVQDNAEFRLLGAADAQYAIYASPEATKLFSLAGKATTKRPALSPANSMRLLDGEPEIIATLAGPEIYRMGELGTAAILLGLAEAALDLIVDYAKIRETFGRKIGAYQAVRHPCADMALRAETARCQLWYAAAAIKEARSDAALHLDAAKHLCNQAAHMNADANIQLHGGIGVTDEHDAHLFLKQAMLLGKVFGSKRALLGRLLDARVQD